MPLGDLMQWTWWKLALEPRLAQALAVFLRPLLQLPTLFILSNTNLLVWNIHASTHALPLVWNNVLIFLCLNTLMSPPVFFKMASQHLPAKLRTPSV